MDLMTEAAPRVGTAAEDLETIRTILPEREGWEIGADACDDGSAYIWANGPDRSAWTIYPRGGEFHGGDGHRPGEAPLTGGSREEVARAIRARANVALVRLDDLPPAW